MKLTEFLGLIEQTVGTSVTEKHDVHFGDYVTGAYFLLWKKEWGIRIDCDFTGKLTSVLASVCLDRLGQAALKCEAIGEGPLTETFANRICEEFTRIFNYPWDFIFRDEGYYDFQYVMQRMSLLDIPGYLEIMKRTKFKKNLYVIARNIGFVDLPELQDFHRNLLATIELA